MLVTLQEVLDRAEQGNFCIPAFNVYNMETVMGVIRAAEESHAPIIMQVYPRLFNEGTSDFLAPIILKAAHDASVPVCFHLDHGPSEKEVLIALRLGATGIMIDGSAHPFEENVALTKRVVELCRTVGVPTEGELGHIGSVNDAEMDAFTDPAQAAEFVEKTGVNCLAVLVGNAHGHYKKTPHLDIDRIAKIRNETGIPLVLHGGTGIPDDQVRAAVHAGVRKMNIGTDVCCAFADGTLEALNDPQHSVAVDVFMKNAIARVKALAENKIALVGAKGQA